MNATPAFARLLVCCTCIMAPLNVPLLPLARLQQRHIQRQPRAALVPWHSRLRAGTRAGATCSVSSTHACNHDPSGLHFETASPPTPHRGTLPSPSAGTLRFEQMCSAGSKLVHSDLSDAHAFHIVITLISGFTESHSVSVRLYDSFPFPVFPASAIRHP